MILMYRKPDDHRDPIVLISSKYKNVADKKLMEIVDGKGYFGTWSRVKLDDDKIEFYLSRLQLNTLYEKQEEKQGNA